jgi:hypothetical protein
MNKRFDLKKLTLTDFKPAAFLEATSKLSLEKQEEKKLAVSPADPVPEGRTTLYLNKQRGIVSSQQTGQSATPVVQPVPLSEPAHTAPQSVNHVAEPAQNPLAQSTLSLPSEPQLESLPNVQSQVSQSTIPLVKEIQEKPLNQESVISILDDTQSSPEINERVAALHAKAIKPQHKKESVANPDDSVAFNTRQPKWLKDQFFMACESKGATPSIVIRNLIKSYLGLCFVLLFVSFPFARSSNDSTYSTDQIITYFYSKTFFGIKAIVPDLKASVGARHSLWQSGSQDSSDFFYTDHSNTRLEAKIEIPILDVSYLKDRSKDKNELRAFVMKSLSKILAAQKSVKILEIRSSSLNTRLDYLRNQITLKLLNKADIFPVENEFYSIQSQLYESQSTLEQRIIELAVISGNDWLEAYKMIIKWDTKLFD